MSIGSDFGGEQRYVEEEVAMDNGMSDARVTVVVGRGTLVVGRDTTLWQLSRGIGWHPASCAITRL
jgi:hypothetical protein